jgi:methionine aminopeptidase
MRMMKPGMKASDIAPILEKIGAAYDVKPVEGVLSHQMKRFVIDGNKVILNKPSPECKVEEAVFQENEVYALDIAYSTGEGKPKVIDEKETNVYKRALDKEYHLKMKV